MIKPIVRTGSHQSPCGCRCSTRVRLLIMNRPPGFSATSNAARASASERQIASVGGFGPDAVCGREIFHNVKAEDAPQVVARLLKAYLANRASPQETFLAFTRRHDIDALKAMYAQEVTQ